MNAIIHRAGISQEVRLINEIIDKEKVSYATDVVNKFLSLSHQNKVLSSIETSLISEAIGQTLKESFK